MIYTGYSEQKKTGLYRSFERKTALFSAFSKKLKKFKKSTCIFENTGIY